MSQPTAESPTSSIRGEDAGFAVGVSPQGGVHLVWGRDGRGAPGPGTAGDLMPAGEDAYARWFRARAPDGTPFLAEIERDAVDPEAFPVAWGPLTNAAVAAVWRRRALAAVSDHDARRVGAPALGFREHPPLVLCREKAALFHPPSPVSGRAGVLFDCRNDEILAAMRLPAWSRSAVRFLRDSAAPAPRTGEAFWSSSRSVPRESAGSVGDFDRFARSLGRLLDPANPASAEAKALGPAFPCVGCDQAARCYPPASAAPGTQPLAPKRLTPVSLHPFHAIAHRQELLTFDEHSDVLGGATWTAFRARHAERWGSPGIRVARESLEREVFGRVEAVDPLTAVTSKLALFESVVEQVLRLHRMHGHPHLALSPDVVVSHQAFAQRGETFDVSIRGELRGPMLEDLMSPPPGPPVWLPPPEVALPWAHPEIVSAAEPRRNATRQDALPEGRLRYGRPARVRVTAGRVWKDAATNSSTCELQVSVAQFSSELSPDDLVRIEITDTGWRDVAMWARLDSEQISTAASLPLRTFPVALDSGQALDLDAAARGKALFGTATVFRTWGAFYDVHSLGMLLLRSLLENSKNRFAQIARDVIPSVLPFCHAVQSGTPEAQWEQLVAIVERVAGTAPLDAFLSDLNACYFPGEISDPERRVPPRLWAEIVATGLVCLTRAEGLGFATESQLERDPEAFARPVERLLEKVRSLRAALPRRRDPRPAAAAAAATAFTREQKTGAIASPLEEENERLRRSLEAEAARVKRLEGEVERLTQTAVRAERAPEPAPRDDAAEAGWRALVEAMVGAPVQRVPSPRPGSPAHDLVRAVAAEGPETLAVLLQALAELGGQEFAAEQRNVQRTVRQALIASAEDSPAARERVNQAIAELREARKRIGGAVGAIVDAHGHATLEGTRRMLQTVAVALRAELGLKGSQVESLDDIIHRFNDRTLELIAMLYDPPFQKRLRRHLGRPEAE
jgi:hypothetical protein